MSKDKIYRPVFFLLILTLYFYHCSARNRIFDDAPPPVVTRGPYLQMGNQIAITIRWRTDVATDTKITWGTSFGTYPNSLTNATSTTEHELRITGLTADTKYYYTVGSTTAVLQGASNNYFVTVPPSNTTRKLRFLAFGDCGNNSTNQVDVKNTFINYIGANDVDAMVLLGDNAYSTGLDNEFQTNFFDVYKDDILRYIKLYPAPGNHDYGNTQANAGVRNNAYYNSFTVPTAAECGGTASGTEAYYSFDIGNVHFLSLDSYGKEDAITTRFYDTLTGAQALWIKNDLTNNTKRWTVAYFHHPPYTKSSHNSDGSPVAPADDELVSIRQNVTALLERFGVDLVLCGHSHGYERSFLLKGFRDLSANYNPAAHAASTLNAKYDGTANSCAYAYASGQVNHGTVYTVAGSAGQIGGVSAGYPMPCMYYSNVSNGGCFYFETDSNRLDAKFISYTTAPTPVIRDQITIFKDVNKVQNITVLRNAPLTLTASWRGTYNWPANGGATTQSVNPGTATLGTFDYTVRDNNTCISDLFHVTVSVSLPVSLLSFTATLKTDQVFLDWATSQEFNNKFFTVEKSTDGINFSALRTVNAAGTSTEQKKYRLIDNMPVEGANYYRLSQTNFDGSIMYLETRKIIYRGIKSLSLTAAYAGQGQVDLIIRSNKTGIAMLRLLDLSGKEISRESFLLASGINNKPLQLRAGIYIAEVLNSIGEKVILKIKVL